METMQQSFSDGIRALLDLIAEHHQTSLSSLLEEGMIDAMILFANRIPNDISGKLLSELKPFFIETTVNVKNERYKYPKNASFLDTIIRLHDKKLDRKNPVFSVPPKINLI